VNTKPGFRRTEQDFSINPGDASMSKALDLRALPEVTVAFSRSAGQIKLDGAEVRLDGDNRLKAAWDNGSHRLDWRDPEGDSVELHLDVSDTGIAIQQAPSFHGPVAGIVAVVNQGVLDYQTVNMQIGITTIVDGRSDPRPSAGQFPIPAPQRISFRVRQWGNPLGELQVDPNGAPLAYIYVVVPSQMPLPGQRPVPSPSAAKVPAPIPVPSPHTEIVEPAAPPKPDPARDYRCRVFGQDCPVDKKQ
jgi:hypothetical protein